MSKNNATAYHAFIYLSYINQMSKMVHYMVDSFPVAEQNRNGQDITEDSKRCAPHHSHVQNIVV